MKFLLLSIFVALCTSAEPLKVISYNVLYGFNHGKSVDVASDWLKTQSADFVALQEMKGFDQAKFAKLAKTWGHDFSYLYKRQPGLPLAFSSRFPISEIKELDKDVRRGILQLKCHDVNFFVIHMTSQKLKFRQDETSYLKPYISELIKRGEKVIVLGDFNSLSPKDAERLKQLNQLLNEMRKNPKKKANLNKGEFDTSILQSYYDLALVDVSYNLLQGTNDLKGSFPSTVLDKIPNKEVQDEHLRRIDYILCDKQTAKSCIKASIPKGGVLEKISDHYPVIVEIDFELNHAGSDKEQLK